MSTASSAKVMLFQHYIFGYGSLLCPQSRVVTVPTLAHRAATPIKVQHLMRQWSMRVPAPAGGWTAMGVQRQENAECVGVLLPVHESELEQFDVRELGYARHLIEHCHIERIAKDDDAHEHCFFRALQHSPATTKVWVYIQEEHTSTSKEHPIPQSYVDIILRGCLSISHDFAREFLTTTQGWESSDDDDDDNVVVHWVNDRHNPLYVRADVHYSHAQGAELDRLLSLYRPHELSQRRQWHFYGPSPTV